MIEKRALDKFNSTLGSAYRLRETFVQALGNRASYAERKPIYNELEAQFSNTSLQQQFVDEIAFNLSQNLRPKEEEGYIYWLNDNINFIDNTYNVVETDHWETEVMVIFHAQRYIHLGTANPHLTEEDGKSALEIIEKVRQWCYECYKGRDRIIDVAKTSRTVRENPKEYEHFVLEDRVDANCIDATQSTVSQSLTEPLKTNVEYDSPIVSEVGTVVDSPKRELTTFRTLLLIRLLQRGNMFPKRNVAMSMTQELEFIGALTGLTYEGHLKKAQPQVELLLDKRLTKQQWQERIKDIRKVKDIIRARELTEILLLIEEYEAFAIQKCENE